VFFNEAHPASRLASGNARRGFMQPHSWQHSRIARDQNLELPGTSGRTGGGTLQDDRQRIGIRKS